MAPLFLHDSDSRSFHLGCDTATIQGLPKHQIQQKLDMIEAPSNTAWPSAELSCLGNSMQLQELGLGPPTHEVSDFGFQWSSEPSMMIWNAEQDYASARMQYLHADFDSGIGRSPHGQSAGASPIHFPQAITLGNDVLPMQIASAVGGPSGYESMHTAFDQARGEIDGALFVQPQLLTVPETSPEVAQEGIDLGRPVRALRCNVLDADDRPADPTIFGCQSPSSLDSHSPTPTIRQHSTEGTAELGGESKKTGQALVGKLDSPLPPDFESCTSMLYAADSDLHRSPCEKAPVPGLCQTGAPRSASARAKRQKVRIGGKPRWVCALCSKDCGTRDKLRKHHREMHSRRNIEASRQLSSLENKHAAVIESREPACPAAETTGSEKVKRKASLVAASAIREHTAIESFLKAITSGLPDSSNCGPTVDLHECRVRLGDLVTLQWNGTDQTWSGSAFGIGLIASGNHIKTTLTANLAANGVVVEHVSVAVDERILVLARDHEGAWTIGVGEKGWTLEVDEVAELVAKLL